MFYNASTNNKVGVCQLVAVSPRQGTLPWQQILWREKQRPLTKVHQIILSYSNFSIGDVNTTTRVAIPAG